MKITMNGNEAEIIDGLTICSLLSQLGIPKPGTAVAINGEIIARGSFESHTISDGDSVDIIRAIGGG